MTTVGQIARQVARELRKNATEAEKLFWSKIRNKQFYGLRFLFQHPIFYFENNRKKFFIVDFYCHKSKIAIEIDGEIHQQQREYDQIRTEILKTKTIRVIRFNNEDVKQNLNKILIDLKKTNESELIH